VFEITRNEFVNFVECEHPETVVVVHLYQNYIPSCMRLNSVLDEIAKKYQKTKIGRIKSTDARPGFDDMGLPALLVYKSGDVVGSYVRVTEELPQGFDIDDLEEFLIENSALNQNEASSTY